MRSSGFVFRWMPSRCAMVRNHRLESEQWACGRMTLDTGAVECTNWAVMPDLFTKPIEEITDVDVSGLLGWPESLTVEFKEALSGKDGRPDSWTRDSNDVEPYARNKLFKEVVAFANTSGGHLILGVAETKAAPPMANLTTPVPRCVDLAERLARAAQAIDPPIPLLLVQGVPTDGGAGVVVFRVPVSRAAPHRALDKECYARRGTSSVPISMREIQDMTLAAGRREERTDARFALAVRQFAEALIGFRGGEAKTGK